MKSIGIIVLNWKQPALTIDTINSLLKITHPNFTYKIIIVDNGSSDDSVVKFKNNFSSNKSTIILETKKNLGYADGNNFGIKYALSHHFDYLLILNNDVLVQPDFLQKIIKLHTDNPHYSLIAPKIYFAPGHEYHQDRYAKKDQGKIIWSVGGHMDWNNIYGSNLGIDEIDHGQYDKINNHLDFLSGCCLFISSNTIKKIGPFDVKYFMYLEDVDLCQRALKAGYQLAYCPDAVIWHINAGSSSSGSNLHDYFLTRNRLLFAMNYANLKTKFAILRESVKILLFSPSIWQKKGVLDFYTNHLGQGSWQ
jgi:hypothetical protein